MQTTTQMYQHQAAAVEKLRGLRVGALYMEMGTGKTRTALELAAIRMEQKKIDHVIWLCPCSVKRNLARDIRKHSDATGNDITICGIETLSSSSNAYLQLLKIAESMSCMLIVDESNLVKNPKAIRSERITNLSRKCPYRLILNGTPISRTEADMFQQWYILDWRILGYQSFYSFAANHIEWDEKFRGRIRRVLNVDYLTDKIAPYAVQIKKEDCLTLPDKNQTVRFFSMTDEQEEHYGEVVDRFLDEANLFEDSMTSVWIYKAFTASQEVASGRRITSEARDHIAHEPMFENPEDNPRIIELLDAIAEDIGTEKAVIWCKFQHEVSDIVSTLSRKGFSCVEFTGSIPQKKRQGNIAAFENDAQFFAATKSCAGYGLNLQFCRNAIYYNNDWDWATRAQSEDRLHRIGQEHNVRIIDICAARSIDQQILSCLDKKTNMVDEFKRNVSDKNWKEWFIAKREEELLDGETVQRQECV